MSQKTKFSYQDPNRPEKDNFTGFVNTGKLKFFLHFAEIGKTDFVLAGTSLIIEQAEILLFCI